MIQYLYAASEMLVLLPAAYMCLLPVEDCLKITRRQEYQVLLGLAGVCLLVALVLALLKVESKVPFLALVLVGVVLYVRIADVPVSQALFFAATSAYICAAATFAAVLVDAYVVGNSLSELYLAWPGMLAQWSLLAASVFLVHRNLARIFMELVETPGYEGVWRFVWLVPALSCIQLIYYIPEDINTLFVGRVGIISWITLISQVMLMAVLYAFMFQTLRIMREQVELTERNRQLTAATQQFAHIQQEISIVRRERHDLRQHMLALDGFLRDNDVEGLRRYVTSHIERLPSEEPFVWCSSQAINGVISYYVNEARDLGAGIDVQVELSAGNNVEEADMVVVLGSLLENAVDALREQVEADPSAACWLHLKVQGKKHEPVFITCDNTHSNAVVRNEDNSLSSTKHEGPGMGTQIVAQVAESLGGVARFDSNEDVFKASVMLDV